MNHRYSLTCLSVTLLSPLAPAMAQDRDARAIEEITVTAQRREQSLQDVPVAVSAFNEQDFVIQQLERMDDLTAVIPNLVVEPTPSANNGARIFLRGIGADESLFTADPAVAIYIDDVYVPRIQGSLFTLFDIERVEVLRGPQGTLYGRNATNGAIRYITRKPSDEPNFKARATYGNFNRRELMISGGGALTDRLSVSAGFMSQAYDGTTTNLTTGEDVNDLDMFAGRLGLRYELADDWSLSFSGDFLIDRSTPLFPVGIGRDFPATNPDNDLFTFNSTLTPSSGLNDMDQWGLSFTLNGEIGDIEVVGVLAHRQYDWDFISDLDGTDAVLLHLNQFQQQDNQSFELRFSSSSDRLSWVAGLFAFTESNEQPTRTDVFGTGSTNNITLDTDAFALFADATYSFSDRLRLTGGIRFSDEQKDFGVRSVSPAGALNFDFDDSDSWSNVTYRAVLDYDVAESVMLYGSYATGFKSGSFNGRGSSPAALTPVDEEEVATWEIGIKSELLDNRLRLNATYFFSVYDDLQVNAVNDNGVFTLVNAAEAEFSGLEFEATARINEFFEIRASGGTLDAEFTDARPGSGFDTSLEPKSAPELTWMLGAFFDHPVGEYTADYSINARYFDDYFINAANSPTIKTDATTLLAARAGITSPDGRWQLSVWGRNLTDEQYFTGGLYVGVLGVETAFINMPRTYGIDFRFNWGD